MVRRIATILCTGSVDGGLILRRSKITRRLVEGCLMFACFCLLFPFSPQSSVSEYFPTYHLNVYLQLILPSISISFSSTIALVDSGQIA